MIEGLPLLKLFLPVPVMYAVVVLYDFGRDRTGEAVGRHDVLPSFRRRSILPSFRRHIILPSFR